MNQTRYRKYYEDYMEGRLDPALREKIRLHLSLNPEAARDYDEFRRLRKELVQAGEIPVPEDFLEKIHGKIEQIKNQPGLEEKIVTFEPESQSSNVSRRVLMWIPFAVAASLILVGTMTWQWVQVPTEQVPVPSPSESPTVAQSEGMKIYVESAVPAVEPTLETQEAPMMVTPVPQENIDAVIREKTLEQSLKRVMLTARSSGGHESQVEELVRKYQGNLITQGIKVSDISSVQTQQMVVEIPVESAGAFIREVKPLMDRHRLAVAPTTLSTSQDITPAKVSSPSQVTAATDGKRDATNRVQVNIQILQEASPKDSVINADPSGKGTEEDKLK